MSVSRLEKFLGWITKLLNSITVGVGVTGSNIQQQTYGWNICLLLSRDKKRVIDHLRQDRDPLFIYLFIVSAQGAIACHVCPGTITSIVGNPTGPETAGTLLVCKAATHNLHAVCLPMCLF